MAGKTTIVKRLMNKPLDQISPTLGFEITTYPYEDQGADGSGETYNLNICNLSWPLLLRDLSSADNRKGMLEDRRL